MGITVNLGNFKKMAGTSAVFISSTFLHASPVERDGETWSADELHLAELPTELETKPPMANVLALEGLEEYDPPHNGDVRHVESLNSDFIYFNRIQGWVQVI